jgi:hypothetical protein
VVFCITAEINVEDTTISQEDAENGIWGDDRDDDGWINWEEEFRQLMLTRREPPASHPIYKFMDKVSVFENINLLFLVLKLYYFTTGISL